MNQTGNDVEQTVTQRAINPGLAKIQAARRENTIELVRSVVEDMRAAHQKINYSTLAKASGLSRTTLHKSHIEAVLFEYPEFNGALKLEQLIGSSPIEERYQMVCADNRKLRQQLDAAQDAIQRLKAEVAFHKKKAKDAQTHAYEKKRIEEEIKANLDDDGNKNGWND